MKKVVNFDRRGFTLIEVIVVAAIIAILAGILVPMIFNQIDESKKTKALGDCKTIQTAMLTFRKDVGRWPDDNATPPVQFTQLNSGSDNTAPLPDLSSANLDGTTVGVLADVLTRNTIANPYPTTLWKGPYLSDATLLDPWGKAYIVAMRTNSPKDPQPYWIISGGPDGIIQSNLNKDEICMDGTPPVKISPCDDIGIKIK